MTNTREKLIELPIDDAILILREEHRQRTDGYTAHLAHGGKGDPAEEVTLDALAMAISALEQTKWIPVTERLPKHGEIVLAFGKRHATSGMFRGTSPTKPNWWHWKGNMYKEVSHWMPLPEPPKGE